MRVRECTGRTDTYSHPSRFRRSQSGRPEPRIDPATELHRLCSIRPAAVITTTESAICPTTSIIEIRNCPRLPRHRAAAGMQRLAQVRRSHAQCGNQPKQKAGHHRSRPRRNKNTGQCSDTSASRGVSAGSRVTSACRLAAAQIKPHHPGYRTQHHALRQQLPHQRAPVAPSALRTAISRSRPEARASIRLATFAHAISRISPTAAKQQHQPRPHRAHFGLQQRHHRHLRCPDIRHPIRKQRQQLIVQSAQSRPEPAPA